MFALISDEKGIGLIEVLVAVVLVALGVIGFLSMQTQGWLLSGRSDFMGRGAEILQKETEDSELLIMNPCNNITAVATPPITVYASGQTTLQSIGDAAFTVQKTIAPVPGTSNMWTLKVMVAWPGNSTGTSESVTVATQEFARYPAGCVNNSVTPNFNF